MLDDLTQYQYGWPGGDFAGSPAWTFDWQMGQTVAFRTRQMPESLSDLREDSRWPAFFPSPMCLVTTGDGQRSCLEKVVGASIVNRFPYVMALSFCRQALSSRHHVRKQFMVALERGGSAAVQFLPPGRALEAAMREILSSDEASSPDRLRHAGLATSAACESDTPIFDDAHLVYEGRLVQPARDFEARPIFASPWEDIGSHRVYFLEIRAIQLRRDIALGESQICWTSLPSWNPDRRLSRGPRSEVIAARAAYQKPFTPHYRFPAASTVAFEADEIIAGRAVRRLPHEAAEQVERDNDRARWPCFFPSSVGMITCETPDGRPNLMPCGSTTIVSRHPLIIAPCVSYAAINARYAPRATLEQIRRTGRFGCGVPYIADNVLAAIRYAGNVSWQADPDKIRTAGLTVDTQSCTPRLLDLPIHFDCEVRGELRLGTHIMFLGEVRRISVREDVSSERPLQWNPWAGISSAEPSVRAA
jgi:flavin reductase (DIM6/NTAB) family NADH-FMN oxidoreductase RutF